MRHPGQDCGGRSAARRGGIRARGGGRGQAAVVGAGTMGGGITMAYANAGIPVILKEIAQEALERGLDTIRKNYAASVAKGRLTPQHMEERLALIQPALSYDRFREADIVV